MASGRLGATRSIALLMRRARASSCGEGAQGASAAASSAAASAAAIGGEGAAAQLLAAGAASIEVPHEQSEHQQPPRDRGRGGGVVGAVEEEQHEGEGTRGWAAPRRRRATGGVGGGSPSSSSSLNSSGSTLMPGRDYYEVLGVARAASDQDIKRAYYKLAKKYHPDTNAGDAAAAAAFQEVSKAYEALRDPEKRRLYDAVGRERMERMESEGGGAGGGGAGGPFGAAGGPFGGPFGGGGAGGGPFGNAADVFEHLFGGGAAGGGDPIFGAFFGGGMGAAVVEAPLRLTFAEAARGTKKWVDVGPGLGGAAGAGGGGPGPVEVSIPAGVDDGQAVEVSVPLGPQPSSGGGRQQHQQQPRLRLRLRVHVEPDPVFRREGPNLHVDASLRLAEALLGRELKVPTLDGGAEVFVPPGTMHGDVLRLRGKGLPDPRARGGGVAGSAGGGGPRGDQYVHVRVAKPKGGLTDRQRDLLAQFDAEERAKGQQQQGQGANGKAKPSEEKKAASA